jgi:hypothetical protein
MLYNITWALTEIWPFYNDGFSYSLAIPKLFAEYPLCAWNFYSTWGRCSRNNKDEIIIRTTGVCLG